MLVVLVLLLGALGLVLLPRTTRLTVALGLVAVEAALIARALTDDPLPVVSGAIVVSLAALLIREIAGTFRLLAQPTSQSRQHRQHDRRDRPSTEHERERRRRVREERRRRDRLAA